MTFNVRSSLVVKSGHQSLSIVTSDTTLVMSMEKIYIKYMNRSKMLWLFGVDLNGYSVSIAVNNFRPSFYFTPPKEWDQEEYADKLTELTDTVNEDMNVSFGDEDDPTEFIHNLSIVKMTPFIGFSNNRRDSLVKVSCSSITVYKKVVDYFKNTYQTYHTEYDMRNQFLQQTNFSYQSWLQLTNVKYRRNDTNCNISGRVELNNMDLFKGEILLKVPPTLKCFVRIKTISRDAALEKKYELHPNPVNGADRIICITMVYIWAYQEDATPAAEYMITTFPDAVLETTTSRMPNVIRCDTESSLLTKVCKNIQAHDPDDIFYFPDFVDTFTYIAQRAVVLNNPLSMCMERFKGVKCKTFVNNDNVTGFRCETRNMFNIQAALKKKVFISIESYDLKTISCHDVLRAVPEDPTIFTSNNYDTNRFITEGTLGRSKIMDLTLRDTRLLTLMARDCGMRIEFANISRVSDTDFTSCISRGEQIRVYNKLSHFCKDENFYENREKLAQKPLRFSIKDRPPTFPDPAEHHITTKLREECYEYLKGKQNVHPVKTNNNKRRRDMLNKYKDHSNFFSEDNEEVKDEEDKAEGGNVMKPCPKFWKKKRIGVLDFASLYPSIMRAFNISYENLVFDEEYLDIPGVNYLFIPVNAYETMAIADVPGLIPKLLALLVNSRSDIKVKMKNETDPFRKSVYDKEQNSMKVLCNATYGFCGAEKKGAILALKPIMYIVTSIGRYLQKKTSDYLAITYNIPSVYGDSVTGDSSLTISYKGKITTCRMDEIYLLDSRAIWKPYGSGKEAMDIKYLYVMDDDRFVLVNRLIRHRCEKVVHRVVTTTGMVDCTADHSLLRPDGSSVVPTKVSTGDLLMHSPKPVLKGNRTVEFAIILGVFTRVGSISPDGKSILFKTRDPVVIAWLKQFMPDCQFNRCGGGVCSSNVYALQMFESCYNFHKEKIVSPITFEMNTVSLREFWKGFTLNKSEHMISIKNKELSHGIWLVAEHLHIQLSIQSVSAVPIEFCIVYRIHTSRLSEQCVVKSVTRMDQDIQYVYDVETDSNHFGVGPGNLVVHNTDSVFVIVEHDDTMSLEDICTDVGSRYKMQDYEGMPAFTWNHILGYYKSRKKPLDLTNEPRIHQVNAVLYLVYYKVSAEVTDIFRKEIILEFENMSDNVWMGWVKKHYCYRFWDPNNPTKIKKIKITGMPVKKREYTPWTRKVLMTVTEMLMYEKFDQIKPYLQGELEKMITNQVPITQLKVSRSYKGPMQYKHFRQAHLQVVLKLQDRHRWPVPEKSRVYFAIVKGKDKLYLRSETPEHIEKHGLDLDLEYYMKQQFFKPMKKLLTYHPEYINFDQLFGQYMDRLATRARDMMNISGGTITNVSKMSLTQAIAKRIKFHQPKKVTLGTGSKLTRSDPFAMFSRKKK